MQQPLDLLGNHPERGVYKTTDGGNTWNLILHTNTSSGAADLIMDPTNPNKLIAAMWEHKRDPWFLIQEARKWTLYHS